MSIKLRGIWNILCENLRTWKASNNGIHNGPQDFE